MTEKLKFCPKTNKEPFKELDKVFGKLIFSMLNFLTDILVVEIGNLVY